MISRRWILGAAISMVVGIGNAFAQGDQWQRQVDTLPWVTAPSIGYLGSIAQIRLTGDLRFLQPAGSSRFIEMNGNPPPRADSYTLAPRNVHWFAVFGYDAIGYVRDDERIDASDLLRTLQEQNRQGMEERRRLGLQPLRLTGWAVPPHYDQQTRTLEWGTQLVGENGGTTVNYTIRLLGRGGVMRAILVSDPQNLQADIQAFKAALRNFSFVDGQRYSEYRQGDHTAEIGLAALIVGGAAAAAAKAGFFKSFGKFIGIGAAALLAAIGALFKRKSGGTPPP